jgi:hypothetical protein
MGDAVVKLEPESKAADSPALMEQYKLYVQMMDATSARRQETNKFFLSVLTLLAVVYPAVVAIHEVGMFWRYVVPVIGLFMCAVWWVLLRSYRTLNWAKFEVIGEFENALPMQPYASEWKHLQGGGSWQHYLPLGMAESFVPGLFAVLYVVLAVAAFFTMTPGATP